MLGGVILQGRVAGGTEGQRHVGGLGEDGGQAGRVAVVEVAAVVVLVHDAGELDAALAGVAAKGAGRRDAAAAGGLVDGRGDGGEHHGGVAGRGAAGGHGGGALATVAAVAELVVVQAACELGLLQVRGDVLVGHLLQAGLEQINLLMNSPVSILVSHISGMEGTVTRKSHTSSSLQALPPPVDEVLRWCFVIPYSWRSITSDVGVYMAGCIAIVIVGDILLFSGGVQRIEVRSNRVYNSGRPVC